METIVDEYQKNLIIDTGYVKKIVPFYKTEMKCIVIIIPTYNRSDYLKRLLSYYSICNIEHKIIIADSSSDDCKIENEKISSSFINLNILHITSYPSTINLLDKMQDIINYVESEYSLFCPDDDFITPNGITQSIDFLENNQDYSVAHGIYVGFSIKQNRENEPYLFWKSGYHPESINFSDAKDRLYHHLANYSFPTLYGVHRTKDLKIILDETEKYTDEVRFGELLPTLLTAIHGKIKCLDVLYAARDASSGSNVYPSLTDYMKDGTYDKKYTKFRDCLTNHLNNESQLNHEEANVIVDNAMSAYLKHYESHKKILTDKAKSLLDKLKLPHIIDRSIRSIYKKLFIPDQWLDFPTFIDEIPKKCHDDLNVIYNHLLHFHDL